MTNPTKDPIALLDHLIRAAVNGRQFEALEAYKACYEVGDPLVPLIVAKMRSGRWKKLGPSETSAYFSCLMHLIHDIDESASVELAKAILQRGCHPVYEAKLRSILSFTLSEFEATPWGSLTIYVARGLPGRETVTEYLGSWLAQIPVEDLKGIRRIYVVERDRLPKLWGYYLNVVSVICLIWKDSYEWNRFTVMQAEITLYHEVGHHVDRRRSDEKESREAFADTYAERLFRKVHPRLGKRWLAALFMPVHTDRKLDRLQRLREGLKSPPD